MKVELAAAYIIHIRPFKDSSALLECLSEMHGLVTLIAKGAKRPRSRMQGLIQPFIPLQLGWVGKGELKTLTQIEAQVLYPKLVGHNILLGLYLNELLIRLLQRHDPHPQLFQDYDHAISTLASSTSDLERQFILRQFELKLLAELGYGLDLTCDVKTGEEISPDLLYSYDPTVGIFETSSFISTQQQLAVSGASIIALHKGVCEIESELKEIKKLMRFVLAHYLGNKPIQSRKLFQHTVKVVESDTHE